MINTLIGLELARITLSLALITAQVQSLPQTTTPTPTQEIPTILNRIAWCESGGKQFKSDGSVVRGIVNPLDIGKYQINLKYHSADAKRLGYDLFTEEGNELYALHLYKTQGTKPWFWSEKCWSSPKDLSKM